MSVLALGLVGDAGNDIRRDLMSSGVVFIPGVDPTRLRARAASTAPPPAITRLGDGVMIVRQLAKAVDSRRSRSGGVSEPPGNAMASGAVAGGGWAVEENREKNEPNLP